MAIKINFNGSQIYKPGVWGMTKDQLACFRLIRFLKQLGVRV